ncbi:hypothetical protein PAXINDRAFT_11294 [Paxillus involutus ATCC 200175]|uniref:Unplaced genomic scaffold PAXINscaffold_13, whole genome shotgun sequence n=1 Tax=Paxillus involutus ATCC 200175 TaxID=664439 RepID=A0A0C9SZZ1_PAXIN|nr:hypothetical protein PAXINDRAFT_11294 [Paxillus involutus ATCC 200175]
MDHIDNIFTNSMLKKQVLDPVIRAALGLAKCTLNRYYSLMDSSDIYRIAMAISEQRVGEAHDAVDKDESDNIFDNLPALAQPRTLSLSYVRNHLSAQMTHALLCVGLWSLLGLVKDNDVLQVAMLCDVEGEEEELEDGWDSISIK